MNQFTGTGTAIITPMFEDQSVDLEGLKRVVEHNIKGGVEFIVALGTTGESATLTGEEKDQVIRTIMGTANGRVPVVIGCGGNDTRKVVKELGEYTKKYKPTGFLSVSPYYNKPSQQGIVKHFSAIAEATDLPIILYNVPGRTSSNMTAETVLTLAHKFKNIAAVKEASGNVEQGMEIIRSRPAGFTVLSGDDSLVLAQVSVGYDGGISVASNAHPQPFSEMIRLGRAGNFSAARKLLYKLLPLMELHFAEGNPSGIKINLTLQGICQPWVRLPLVSASADLKTQIKKELDIFLK